MKCGNLSLLDSGPLPFCFPVREVTPPEHPHLASGGDFPAGKRFGVKSTEWVDHEHPFLVASHFRAGFGCDPELLSLRSDGSRPAGT